MRVFKAFLLAPIPAIIAFFAATFLPEFLSGDISSGPESLRALIIFFLLASLIISYALIAVFWLPIFLALRIFRLESAFLTIFLAALIGSSIELIPELIRVINISDGGTLSSRMGSCQTIIDNVRTRCGYIMMLETAGFYALFGALAGGSFWVVYKNPNAFRLSWIFGFFFLSGIAPAGAVYATADRSCHNMFQDGRTSIGPTASFDIDTPPGEWNELAEFFNSFAVAQGFSFRDRTTQRGQMNWLNLSVCNNVGVNIVATDDPFPDEGGNVKIELYVTNDEADWQPVWNRLKSEIEGRWKIYLKDAE